MKPDLLVLRPTLAPQMQVLAQCYTLHRYDLSDAEGRAVMLAGPGQCCEAIVTDGHTPLTRDMIAQLPALKVVACASAGYEMIDVDALAEHGVVLTNTSDALFDDVADTALLLTMAARRALVAAHAHVASGNWGTMGAFPLQSSLRGKKLGIVGMGRIGRAISGRAQAVGLETAYFSRTAKPDVDLPFQPDLLALAHWADILVVIVAGGAGTRNLIDDPVLRALGPQGTLINVSRGSVVDETALIAALRDGGLGSAGLDVFWNEPNPDPALTALPNVTLYPHHASGTVETRVAMAQLVVDNLAAHFAGQPLLTPVNLPV
ncbi:2-hydroxyacid dehydrogenase [Pseudotabrizicola sediminis]|uniref:2-hydroxyacid dehydrogenase n=1 Tax=Pseudotabrizicola sediminis TaxID=2486418 RepID=A0ABY2KM05_9RHOB|nr:2-hydroxyacid dehydrogenase [Pseudotabrizicola sediminis]TGD41922.1 2-hydroxyacid dehydrogenase [Pseudotabrizicola sediminis]